MHRYRKFCIGLSIAIAATSLPLSTNGQWKLAPVRLDYAENGSCAVVLEDKQIEASKEKTLFIAEVGKRLNEQIGPFGAQVAQIEIRLMCQSMGKAVPKGPGVWHVWLDKCQLEVTELQVTSTLEHEFAHVLYENWSEYRRICEKRYYNKMTDKQRCEFMDDLYVHDGSGHPEESSNELFASAFSIASMAQEGLIEASDIKLSRKPAKFYKWLQGLPLFKVRDAPCPEWNPTKPASFLKMGNRMVEWQ